MARYNAACARGLGWTLTVLGSLSIALGTATTVVLTRGWAPDPAAYISAPVWSGMAVVATGILAILSGKRPENRCLIIALLVLSIVTIVFAMFCCLLTVAEAHLAERCVYAGFPRYTVTDYNRTREGYNVTLYEVSPPECSAAALPLQVTCEILAFVEAVLGLVVSVTCCCGLAGTPSGQPVIYIRDLTTAGDGADVILPTGSPTQDVSLTIEGDKAS